MQLATTIALLLLLGGCGTTYERASEDPSIDEPAMSTRLDRVDLELALGEWMEGFNNGEFIRSTAIDQPNIAILRIANDSSEQIGGALDNLLNSIETRLVQSGRWNVIDNTLLTENAVIAERLRQMGDTVDPETRSALGKEYGIHYFINGRVGETAEKVEDTRRVQYYLFLRVTELSTNKVVHQEQIDITKQASG